MENRKAQDISIPGGIVHNPASPFAREMAKFEMGYSPYGPPGRPRDMTPHQDWPALFYKVKRSPTNGDFLVEHYQEAESEMEAANLESRGYRRGRAAAQAFVEQCEREIAYAAAERAASDRKMSENARREAAAADDATSEHVAVVPVTPIRKRGRPAKVAEPA